MQATYPAPATDDVWYGNGSLWLASETPDGGLYRVSPVSGKVLARDAHTDAIQLTFSPGVVWAAAAAGPTALDATSAQKLAGLPPSDVPSQGTAGIALVGSRLWVSYGDIQKLQEVRISH